MVVSKTRLVNGKPVAEDAYPIFITGMVKGKPFRGIAYIGTK